MSADQHFVVRSESATHAEGAPRMHRDGDIWTVLQHRALRNVTTKDFDFGPFDVRSPSLDLQEALCLQDASHNTATICKVRGRCDEEVGIDRLYVSQHAWLISVEYVAPACGRL